MIYNSPLELIGNSPLLKVSKITKESWASLYLKLEIFNLTGSVKDRPARFMIESAETAELITPNKTVLIESTSGNLGMSLAAISAYKGYRFICVLDPKVEDSKLNALKALGAEVVMVTTPDKDGGFQKPRIKKVKELLRTIPNTYNLDQYANPNNPKAHVITTGQEIYEDLNDSVDILIGAVSTGGTLCGTARYLKSKIPKLTVIGVEPYGSVLFGGTYRPYLQQGTGLSFQPSNYDPKLIDRKVRVSDSNAFNTARQYAKTSGVLIGGSSGGVLYIALQIASSLPPNKIIVAIMPDNGDRYLDTVYSDKWLAENV